MILEVEDLVTQYKIRKGSIGAVAKVSFNLSKGEVLGLAGESGCGKTTTCLSIMRMIQSPGEIVSGNIYYENVKEVLTDNRIDSLSGKVSDNDKINLLDIKEVEMRRIRGNHIAMIFQGAMNALNPVHRIGNQILEAITIHQPQVEKKEAWESVIKILEVVGIDSSRARDYPHQLSGGMKQRALIAMALVNNPDIIIADEPVTALDVIVQSQVLKATKNLQTKFNLSMIMITHDLSVIAEVCDKLAIMYAGKIVEYGNNRTLFKEPLHPYTEALLNSFPSILGEKKELFDIGGSPPNLLNPPTGCRFHPRCGKAMEICSKVEPKRTKTKEGYVACHLHG